MEISTSIIYDEKGEPAYIQSIVRDISRRKEVERALQRRSQIMAAINTASTRLLQSTHLENNIGGVLETLGQASGATTCFIVEVRLTPGPATPYVLFQWKKESSFRLDIAKSLAASLEAILSSQTALFSTNLDIPSARSVATVQIIGRSGSRVFLGLFVSRGRGGLAARPRRGARNRSQFDRSGLAAQPA